MFRNGMVCIGIFCALTNGLLAAGFCDKVCTDICTCTKEIVACSDVTVDESIFPCFNSSVMSLIIDNINITELTSADFATLTGLQIFSLSNSPTLTNITENAFSSAAALWHVWISTTGLIDIDDTAFVNVSLTGLTLTDNQLSTLNLTEPMKSLTGLDLSQNGFEDFPGILTMVPALTQCNMSHNRLGFISNESLSSLPNLEELYLSSNTIDGMSPDAFQSLQNLRELHLQDNSLTGLPKDLFYPTHQLQKLDLSSNLLMDHQALAFNNNTNMNTLYFRNNLIDRVRPHMIDRVDHT